MYIFLTISLVLFGLLLVVASLIPNLLDKASTKDIPSGFKKVGLWVRRGGYTVIALPFLLIGISSIPNCSGGGSEEQDTSSQMTAAPIEADPETWTELQPAVAPVGEFIAVDVPSNKHCYYKPLGSVWILPPGRNKKAFLYQPGDPWPELGTVWGDIRYMSAEGNPVEIRRWAKDK